ncbi:MAG: DNA-processing protein DprA [Actinomycetota bacterium]
MPTVLYGRGARPDAFAASRVAVVGTRSATPMGLADARELGRFCARSGITLVSGLAIGIDAAAHEGALDAGGLTVGVVATGLDVVYPRRHERLFARVRDAGLIVGEHPDGTPPAAWRFPIRNRIIAAIADVVVVVEAATRGGALHTARYAAQYGRDVLALPASRRNPVGNGTNRLLADGAVMLLDPTDLLVALQQGRAGEAGWGCDRPPPADPDQLSVLHAFGGDGATTEELEHRSALPPERLGPALRALERTGRAERRRGMWWPATSR